MNPDYSIEAQRAVLAKHPNLKEHGFHSVGGLPLTEPALLEKLVEWVKRNPPTPKDSSYSYKHRAEDGRFWTRSQQVDGESADVGYVSNGEIILACIMAGYEPIPYYPTSVNCWFKKWGSPK